MQKISLCIPAMHSMQCSGHDQPMNDNINGAPPALSWDGLQVFLCVAEHGSLSKAAAYLQISQPTLTRQVAALEQQLGVPLFERTPRGMALTDVAQALLAPVQAIRQQVLSVGRISQGHDDKPQGVVRITASETVATYLMPPMLTELRQLQPQLDVVLLATDRVANLIEREADIAVRMVRPDQPDLVARKVADLRIGIYAHRSYLQRRGRPASLQDLASHDVIGFGDPLLLQQSLQAGGMDAAQLRFALLSNSHVTAWEMVRAGLGIGFIAEPIGKRFSDLERLLPDAASPSFPIWLTVHQEVRSNARLRQVFDFLADRFATLAA